MRTMKNGAYKYRFTPTEEQATLLAQTFGRPANNLIRTAARIDADK